MLIFYLKKHTAPARPTDLARLGRERGVGVGRKEADLQMEDGCVGVGEDCWCCPSEKEDNECERIIYK